MQESREALAQKIEMLEEKVTETVQTATATVAEATANVLETVQNATASVTDTVDTVTSAVQGTVDTVRQSVEGTVDSVKDAFDISRQVEQHPWLMMAGAVATGFVAGTFLAAPSRPGERRMESMERPSVQSLPMSTIDLNAQYAAESASGNGRSRSGTASAGSNGHAKTAFSQSASWLSDLASRFAPEISKLEGLAVGVVMGSVRDMITESVPQAILPQVNELIDGLTEKLGGQKIRGSILPESNA